MPRAQRILFFVLLLDAAWQVGCAVTGNAGAAGADRVFFVVYALAAYAMLFFAARALLLYVLGFFVFRRGPDEKVFKAEAALLGGGLFLVLAFANMRIIAPALKWGDPKKLALTVGIILLAAAAGAAAARLAGKTPDNKFAIKKQLKGSFNVAFALVCVFVLMHRQLAVWHEWDYSLGRAEKTVSAESGLPNVVLITIDTMSVFETDFFAGTGSTPAMAALAREGVVFPDTVAPAPMTSPSHATILTGMAPQDHGVLNNADSLPGDVLTLAEILREKGYATHAITNMFAMDPTHNFHQGFDSFHENWRTWSAVREMALETDLFFVFDKIQEYIYGLKLRPLAEFENLEKARELLKREKAGPFFLWYHTYLPHSPYAPLEEVKERFGATGFQDYGIQQHHDDFRSGKMLGPELLEKIRALYRGDIYMADSAVAKIAQWLRESGALDETILVIAADHGETFQGHSSFMGHQEELYEDTLRVPLIFRYPALIPAAGARNETASLADVTPTVLDIVGADIPEAARGRSLLPLMYHGDDVLVAPRTFISETIPPQGVSYKLAIQRGGIKYIFGHKKNSEELYDVAADPREKNDLAADPRYLPDLEYFREESEKWFSERRPRMNARAADSSPETMRKLKDLGYIQ